jgi:hypothetical protein
VQHSRSERIEVIWTVERQGQDSILDLILDCPIAHLRSDLFAGPSRSTSRGVVSDLLADCEDQTGCCLDLFDGIVVEAIVNPGSATLAGEYPGPVQHLQVVTDCGL